MSDPRAAALPATILPALRALLRLLLLALCGCAAAPAVPTAPPTVARAFNFHADTLSFDNQLNYEYQIDPASGKVVTRRNAGARYTLHCFVLVRSVRQFYQFARFDPSRPPLDDAGYRALVRQVIAHDPSEAAALPARIVIPGYPDLRSFSRAREALLKDELGGALQSYLQRGNWRMVLPFSDDSQRDAAQMLAAEVAALRPPLVHVFNFPHIDINHALLLYEVHRTRQGLEYLSYDPNDGSRPYLLRYDAAKQRFSMPPNRYFAGGTVKLYQIYRSTFY